MQKPWYWKARKAWYLNTDEGRVCLGENQNEAYEQWRLLSERQRRIEANLLTVADVFGLYAGWAKEQVRIGELKQTTLDDYASYFDWFAADHGDMWVGDVMPSHVTDWMMEHPTWGPAAQAHAIRSLNRAFNWATGERRIDANPIRGVKIPRQRRRTTLIPDAVHGMLVQAAGSQPYSGRIDRQFRLMLVAIRHCGGRSQDVANVRVEHVDRGVSKWTIPEHKRLRHTGQPRVVYLSPCLQSITRMLRQDRTTGPLFQGRRGAISTNAITCRIKKLKKLLGLEDGIVAYAYRHTFITDALERGVDIATVAELVGTSVTMIEKNYGHLGQRSEHLKEAARRAVGG